MGAEARPPDTGLGASRFVIVNLSPARRWRRASPRRTRGRSARGPAEPGRCPRRRRASVLRAHTVMNASGRWKCAPFAPRVLFRRFGKAVRAVCGVAAPVFCHSARSARAKRRMMDGRGCAEARCKRLPSLQFVCGADSRLDVGGTQPMNFWLDRDEREITHGAARG